MKGIIAIVFFISIVVASVFTIGYLKNPIYEGTISKTFNEPVDSIYSFCINIELYNDYRDDLLGMEVLETNKYGIRIWQEFDLDGGIDIYELLGKNENISISYRRTNSSSATSGEIHYRLSGNESSCLLRIEEVSKYEDPFFNFLRIFTGSDHYLKSRMSAVELHFSN
jgi:hypothetical protein